MNNLRGNIIILIYGVLIYQLISGGRPSLFVYLMALLVELVLLLTLYIIPNLTLIGKGKINIINVLIGVIPLLLFNYVIIYFASAEIDNFQGGIRNSEYGLLQPLFDNRKQFIMIAIGILIGYSTEFWKQGRLRISLRKIESKVLSQALKIWIMGIVATVVVLMIPSEYYLYGIALIPISRILMEFIFDFKLNVDPAVRIKRT